MCTAYHYNHNLDPYGEMSRPAVRKVETTEGSRSPSLSWTFLKSHKLSVFVFVFAPLLLTFLKALATMARSPFSSFAISKILSELFSTSTVCVYGLYLRQKECKKWLQLRSQNTSRWTAFWCRRRWPSQTQWHFPESQCKSTASGMWSPRLKSFRTSLQLRRMSNHDLSAANRFLLQLQ